MTGKADDAGGLSPGKGDVKKHERQFMCSSHNREAITKPDAKKTAKAGWFSGRTTIKIL